MNRKAIISTMMAMSLTTSGFAFAQGYGDQHDRGDNRDNRHDRHAQQQDRGAGPHFYHRGDRISSSERSRRYVVNDWRGHNLRSPPRGYHWVQSGNDFILVAITTGIIADYLLNH